MPQRRLARLRHSGTGERGPSRASRSRSRRTQTGRPRAPRGGASVAAPGMASAKGAHSAAPSATPVRRVSGRLQPTSDRSGHRSRPSSPRRRSCAAEARSRPSGRPSRPNWRHAPAGGSVALPRPCAKRRRGPGHPLPSVAPGRTGAGGRTAGGRPIDHSRTAWRPRRPGPGQRPRQCPPPVPRPAAPSRAHRVRQAREGHEDHHRARCEPGGEHQAQHDPDPAMKQDEKAHESGPEPGDQNFAVRST